MNDDADPEGPRAGPGEPEDAGPRAPSVRPGADPPAGGEPPPAVEPDAALAPVKLESWADLVGSKVVLDTDSSFIFLGTLEAASAGFLTLADADVHDMRDSSVTKEMYSLEALKYGVRANRRRTYVRVERTLCVSRLEDVIRY